MAGRDLGSKWASLNANLLARIFPCDTQGIPLPDENTVVSPLTEAAIELSANWQSPFENMGPESKAPALMAMMQTGMISTAFMSLTGAASALLSPSGPNPLATALRDGINKAAGATDDFLIGLAANFQGVTGMTKLNSTQVFTGSAPVKFPLTLQFRAFSDPAAEVQEPIDQLSQWTLPVKLSTEGSILGAVRGLASSTFTDPSNFANSVFPSRAPRYVGLKYAGYLFAPLVIEHVSYPLVVPRTRDGEPLSVSVQLALASVTALDAEDWRRARRGQPAAMFQTKRPGTP